MKAKPIVIAAIASALLAPTLEAATVLNYANSQAVEARANFTGTVGSIFLVNVSGQQVTHLGVMDADAAVDGQDPDGADGLSGRADDDGFLVGPISVGLWSWNGTTATLLASTTVSSTDTYTNGYRYVALGSAVTLDSGQQYILGARVGGGIEWFLDGQNQSSAQFSASSSDFTLLKSTHNGGAAFTTAPTTDGTGVLGRWGPANAIVSPISVPEPSIALLSGLGVLGLLRRRRN